MILVSRSALSGPLESVGHTAIRVAKTYFMSKQETVVGTHTLSSFRPRYGGALVKH